MKKVLLIRFSSIGDIVLTTPVVRAIKQQMPGVTLHVATKQSYASLYEANPHVDQVFALEDSLLDLVAQLRKERYDFVVDLHNNLRTRIIKTLLMRPSAAFPKLNKEKYWMVRFKKDILPRVHIVERYFEAAKPLGVKNDGLGLEYYIRQPYPSDQLPNPWNKGYIAFAIGAQHATKRLPVERLIEVCAAQKRPIILLGGKEEYNDGVQVADALQFSGPPILNLCGQLSLDQSADLVRQSEWVISHDTGLMHIAAAFHKRIRVFWGSTIPEFGMYPYLTEHENVEVKGLTCRPCSKIGFDACPEGHFQCMRNSGV